MSQEIVNSLNTQVEQQIHGAGREQIVQELGQNPTSDKIAEIAYSIIMSLDTQAAQQGPALELDILMGVATETIDILLEILEAMGQNINADEFRDESLIKMVLLHMKAVENNPEEKQAAQELLEVLAGDGTLDQSMGYIDSKAGATTEEMKTAGMAMAAPQQKPVAAGVRRGLMQ